MVDNKHESEETNYDSDAKHDVSWNQRKGLGLTDSGLLRWRAKAWTHALTDKQMHT
jgi:hypothetical protein